MKAELGEGGELCVCSRRIATILKRVNILDAHTWVPEPRLKSACDITDKETEFLEKKIENHLLDTTWGDKRGNQSEEEITIYYL